MEGVFDIIDFPEGIEIDLPIFFRPVNYSNPGSSVIVAHVAEGKMHLPAIQYNYLTDAFCQLFFTRDDVVTDDPDL